MRRKKILPSELIAPHVLTEGKKPKSQIFLKFYFIIHYNNNHVCLFVCNRGDTIQYHGSLRSRELHSVSYVYAVLPFYDVKCL